MVTDKQWKVIRFIENNLGIKFNGKWKEEATVFISLHIERSKHIATERSLEMRRLMQEEEEEFTAEDYYLSLDWYDFC